jgi:hypothetical protein
MTIEGAVVSSVEEFIGAVRDDSREWQQNVWFRGEPGDVEMPLLPKLYRPRRWDGGKHDENKLLQTFRMKAPIITAHPCPDVEATDQWLFLAQHVGVPTRLLDWTESALIGLYFALLEPVPVVWMLPPFALNQKSDENAGEEFPLTWFRPEQGINIGSTNIGGAWTKDRDGVPLPVAVQPTNIHPRMSVQRSCFTVHGKDKGSVVNQVPTLLKRYDIEPSNRNAMWKDIRLLGISHSTVWPDLDGLARELRKLY